MTMLSEHERVCSVCNAKSKQTVILSTNTFGPPDLDWRPAQMQRSTMAYWVEECPQCGFASDSVARRVPLAYSIIASSDYQSVMVDETINRLCRRLLKASLISEGEADLQSAAEYALNAAWAADDVGDEEGAMQCRNRAVDLFERFLLDVDEQLHVATDTRVRLVDIFRRTKRWAKSKRLAEFLLRSTLDVTTRSIIVFGQAAASRQDNQCYTAKDAIQAK